jgi:hypothetical protein
LITLDQVRCDGGDFANAFGQFGTVVVPVQHDVLLDVWRRRNVFAMDVSIALDGDIKNTGSTRLLA